MNTTENHPAESCAKAEARNLSVSTKHCVEICRALRQRETNFAKAFLEEVIALRKPVPFLRFKRDVSHKRGMAAGRYPQKAAKEILALIKSAEANAQVKNMNVSDGLKITKLMANKASIPYTGGRQRHSTKRSHLEIEVRELRKAKADQGKARIKVKKETTEKEVLPAKKEAISSPKGSSHHPEKIGSKTSIINGGKQ